VWDQNGRKILFCSGIMPCLAPLALGLLFSPGGVQSHVSLRGIIVSMVLVVCYNYFLFFMVQKIYGRSSW
jgi:hypothetical protein